MAFLLPNVINAQDYAIFTIDSTRLFLERNHKTQNLPNYVTQQEWYINGQKMTFLSDTVKVRVNAQQMDTILFGWGNNFDTLLCNISQPKEYRLFYIACCSAFNIQDVALGKFISGNVNFELKNSDTSKRYLALLSDSGILLNGQMKDTLTDHCRSAMSNSFYKLELKEIYSTIDSTKITEETCLQTSSKDAIYFNYQTKRTFFSINYFPLSSQPEKIIYDFESGELRIE
ncbi:hypothetical protein SAMN05216474_0243 [Lishizhenia tianjinensis]|uniref:Uncharacterized protein n=2 Tax=Lishizhenia tianjinensis TaxID=477690 RepID=A0A1I6XKD3_9FLAO|nr:hypothetical protein SAMN05216474_0243 [Lishizhenia tianjinensis]